MKARPSDSPAVIRIEDGTVDRTQAHWFVAMLLLGVSGWAVWHFKLRWNFNPDSKDFNPMVIIPIALGFFGLQSLAKAGLGTLRSRKAGKSVLEIDAAAVRMGTTIRGKIFTAADLHPLSDYEISLQCLETFEFRASESSTSITRDESQVRWETTARVAAEKSTAGIPFEFTLPETLEAEAAPQEPGSLLVTRAVVSANLMGRRRIFAHHQKPAATHWRIRIRAPFAGADYEAAFAFQIEPAPASDRKK